MKCEDDNQRCNKFVVDTVKNRASVSREEHCGSVMQGSQITPENFSDKGMWTLEPTLAVN